MKIKFNSDDELPLNKAIEITSSIIVVNNSAIKLLRPVSIYCYPIKYKAKQKYLLPFYVTNNKLKEFLY